MFGNKRRAAIAKKFGITENDLLRAAGRIAGYLSKHCCTCEAPAVADALRFLADTIEEVEEKREKAEFAHHFRNPSHRKWEIEVVRLYQSGYGAKRISDAIADRKGPRIPKSTIERFLVKNGITRGR